ncbi:MAG: 3-hydroxyacyl-CoA dehydrogenase family protein [Acidobacteria bacterium]|nr:3-hydroxyacyl-CoA dehydrogenase family protein [Acidobacteriota bacterium]
MEFRLVGVIGAGVMGTGVAQSLAVSGHRVALLDVSAEILARARREVAQGLRFQGLFGKGGKRADAAEVLGRIEFTTELEALAGADFVVENVTEKWEVKRQVYEQLDPVCPEHCVFAANTSAIPITRIASATRRPRRVLGIHFMNPVPLKPTAEVIRGHHTSDETIETALALLASMGKTGIVVNDSPGFVTNRVLMLTINEAAFLLQEGVASAEQVDEIFKSCFGHKMGPLETADLIGLDTILLSIEVLYEAFNDSKYRPCPLLKKMVDAGLLGRKSGEGFYKY